MLFIHMPMVVPRWHHDKNVHGGLGPWPWGHGPEAMALGPWPWGHGPGANCPGALALAIGKPWETIEKPPEIMGDHRKPLETSKYINKLNFFNVFAV